MNNYIGNFTEGERRLIETAFQGWTISRPNVPGPQFEWEKGLYKASFGPETMSSYSIEGLVELGLADPGDKTGSIVPPRTVDDTSYPRMYRQDVDKWPESIAFEDERARQTILKSLGR